MSTIALVGLGAMGNRMARRLMKRRALSRRLGTGRAQRYPPRFSLAPARKHADLVAEAAARAGVDPRLAEAARSWLREAEESGLGEADYSAMLVRILSR